jgi:hypothetical protein
MTSMLRNSATVHHLANVLIGMGLLGGAAVATLLWDGYARASAQRWLLFGSTRYVAYLITRPQDCRSHLESLRMFDRGELRTRVSIGGIILVGKVPGRREAEAWIARERPDVRVLAPGFPHARLLRELGWRGAPRIIVLDRRTRSVRFARDAPITIEEQRATRAAIIAAVLA